MSCILPRPKNAIPSPQHAQTTHKRQKKPNKRCKSSKLLGEPEQFVCSLWTWLSLGFQRPTVQAYPPKYEEGVQKNPVKTQVSPNPGIYKTYTQTHIGLAQAIPRQPQPYLFDSPGHRHPGKNHVNHRPNIRYPHT